MLRHSTTTYDRRGDVVHGYSILDKMGTQSRGGLDDGPNSAGEPEAVL